MTKKRLLNEGTEARAVVMHVFNPKTLGGKGRQISIELRLTGP